MQVEDKMSDEKKTGVKTQTKTAEFSKTPEKILIFTGKRKSGKDFITDKLHRRIGDEKCVIIKLSGPIKSHWAKTKNLDIYQLLGDGNYKEIYRSEMIEWGEKMRKEDYGYFCKAAIHMYCANNKPIWIVSDARRKSDVNWFIENYGNLCKTIRLSSNDEVRASRGWIFCKGIDDCESECNLDDVINWDLQISNNGEDIELILQSILDL